MFHFSFSHNENMRQFYIIRALFPVPAIFVVLHTRMLEFSKWNIWVVAHNIVSYYSPLLKIVIIQGCWDEVTYLAVCCLFSICNTTQGC